MTSAVKNAWVGELDGQIKALVPLIDRAPGARPGQRTEAKSIADEISAQVNLFNGQNLDVFLSAARTLRGPGKGLKWPDAAFPSPGSAMEWFDAQGIADRERKDTEREVCHFDKRDRVAERIEQCCCCVETIQDTAKRGIELLIGPPKAVLEILRKLNFPQLIPDALDMLIQALKHAKDMILDLHDCVRSIFDEIASNICEVADEQPEPVVEYKCQPAPCPAPVEKDPGSVQHTSPQGTAPAPTPTPTPAPTPAPAPAPAPQQSPLTTLLEQVAPNIASTVAAASSVAETVSQLAQQVVSAAPSAIERLCEFTSEAQNSTTTTAPTTTVSTAGSPSVTVNIQFDFNLDSGLNAGVETVGCEVASQIQPPAQQPDTSQLALTALGRLGGAAVLGGIEFLGQLLDGVSHCTCNGACQSVPTTAPAATPEPAPQPQPAPEPAPQPAPQPQPQPAPTPHSPVGEGVIPPPPELAEVPQPVPPQEKLEKMEANTLPQGTNTGGSSWTVTPAKQNNTETPNPGGDWGSKKLGEW